MAFMIRNRSLANRPSEAKLLPFNEILLADAKQQEILFRTLVNHLLANTCPKNKCHDLCQQLSDITDYVLSLKDLQPFSKQLDRLLVGFKVVEVEEEVIDKYCSLIYTLIDLKPFKLEAILKDVIIEKLKGFKEYFDEQEIQPKEQMVFNKIHSVLKRLKLSHFETKLLSSYKTRFPMINGPNICVHPFICYIYNGIKACDYVSNKKSLIVFIFEKILEYDTMFVAFKTNNKINNSGNQSVVFDANKANDVIDHIMQTLFTAIDDRVEDKSDEELKETFDLFTHLFNEVMLRYKDFTHLVYVWLYLCSLSKQFSDQFIQYLWDYGLTEDNSVMKRERSLNFLSFLLKSANHVSIDQIISFMNMSSNWVHNYIDKNDRIAEELTTNDSIFYIICQNLFDIFCSIHSDLDNLRLRRIKSMNFQRIIKCKLSPLDLCCQEIENQFLSLARHYQIGYCPQNEDSDENRLDHPLRPLYYLPKTQPKVEQLCRYIIDGHHFVEETKKSRNRYTSYNSDESDYCNGSFINSKKNLLQNQLSDSSLNELIDY